MHMRAQSHRLPRLDAFRLEHDSKGAVAHDPLSEVPYDLLGGTAAARCGDHMADVVRVAFCGRCGV